MEVDWIKLYETAKQLVQIFIDPLLSPTIIMQ